MFLRFCFFLVCSFVSLFADPPFVVTDPAQHTMGVSLFPYLDMKVHEWIQEKTYRHIWVVGDFDRTQGVSVIEKSGKRFNWQRPIAEEKGDDLYIKCFPGRDYVYHYAALISTYLAINNRPFDHVEMILPTQEECYNALKSSNLVDLPKGKVAVFGHGLEYIVEQEGRQWEGEGSFSWVKTEIGGVDVVYVGCRHSIWGDIGGQIIRLLAEKGFTHMIYLGKLGTLQNGIPPNEYLATGNTSFVDGKWLIWDNIFESARGDPQVYFGRHVTLSSVICETKEFLNIYSDFDFVDPEMGQMAKAAQEYCIGFSNLHIISDNLKSHYDEDLSNERIQRIRDKRQRLLEKMRYHLYRSISAMSAGSKRMNVVAFSS